MKGRGGAKGCREIPAYVAMTPSFMQNRELQTEAVGEEKQTERPLNGSTHMTACRLFKSHFSVSHCVHKIRQYMLQSHENKITESLELNTSYTSGLETSLKMP